jgi:tetratricopeptide (TPR) repeat protein
MDHGTGHEFLESARKFRREGERDLAKQTLKEGVRRFPEYQPSLAFLAQWELADGNYTPAVEWLRRLLDLNPESKYVPQLMNSMGIELSTRPPHLTVPPGSRVGQVIAKPDTTPETLHGELNALRSCKIRVREEIHGFLGPERHLELRGLRLPGSIPQQGDWIAFRDSDGYEKNGVVLHNRLWNLSTRSGLAVDNEARPGYQQRTRELFQKIALIVKVLWVVGVLVTLSIFFWNVIIVPAIPAPVPSVVGLQEKDARVVLRDHHFQDVRTRLVQDALTLRGQVVAVEPAAGTSIPPTSALTLVLADPIGPPGSKVPVPNVVGMMRADAERYFNNIKLKFQTEGEPAWGRIVRTEPAAGTLVEPSVDQDGTLVHVYVAPP